MKNNLPPFWKWENPLPENLIAQAIADSNAEEKSLGKMFGDVTNAEYRNSEIVMLPAWNWMCGVMMNFAIHANISANWKREITRPECVQYAEYGVGQFYDWHTDSAIVSDDPENRKLSVICMLSDLSEYDGGEFHIEGMPDGMILSKGSIIVFPSGLRHKVAPVTRGIRRSAVCWILGPARW